MSEPAPGRNNPASDAERASLRAAPSRWKAFAGNAALLAGTLAVTLLALEQVVFRFVLVPDDLVENVSINGVVRYRPGTEATFRHPDGRRTTVTVNADGWNSTKPAYVVAKTPGRARIAIVGDSYVHGAFVDVKDGFPELVETGLKSRGIDAEVYRFGMDGAPLSQYLHVIRREVLRYSPDVVVVPLIHNDFDETYRLLKTRYASSFMKLSRDAHGNVEEIAPADFRYGTADTFRNWRTFRYLYYKTGFYLHAKSWISRHFWGGDEEWKPEFISSAVDIRKISDHEKNRFYARYVVDEMAKLSREHGFKLAFVMDGVREAVYARTDPLITPVGRLNAIAAEVTEAAGVPFVDLHSAFAEDFAKSNQRFEFPYDWHWNERGNAIVARQIVEILTTDPRVGRDLVRRAAHASKD